MNDKIAGAMERITRPKQESGKPRELLDALENLRLRDHLCLIYDTHAEQFAAAIPFMRIGLERGERCVYVADDNTVEAVIDAMSREGIDVNQAQVSGALQILTSRDAYLKRGYFDPDWMIRFLKEATRAAIKAGFKGLRVTGEMTWVLGGEPGTGRLIEYEAKLNYFFPVFDCLALCQYNRNLFEPETILDIIRTHPLLVYGTTVCRNMYYTPPEEFLAGGEQRAQREVERQLAGMVERERIEHALRESESTFRTMFDASPESVTLLDSDGTVISVNAAAASRLGRAVDDVIGCRIDELFPEEISSRRRQAIERVFETGKGARFDDRRGGYFFENHLEPIRNAAGQVDRVLIVAMDVTDRKRKEEEIGRERDLVAGIMDTSPVGIMVIDSSGRFRFANSRAEEILGISKDEIVQRAYNEVSWRLTGPDGAPFPEEQLPFRQAIVNRAMVRDVRFGVERADGNRLLLSVNASPMFNDEGGLERVVVTFEDITEQTRAGEELVRSEAELNRAQQLAQVGSWAWDAETDTITWSEAYYRIYGLDPRLPTPNYEDHLAVYTPESARRLDEAVKRAMETGEPYELDLELARPDAERWWITARGEARRDSSGRIMGLRGTAQNITQRKRAEDEIRKGRERFRSIYDSSPVGIELYDAGGILIDVNPACLEIFGVGSIQHIAGFRLFEDPNIPPEIKERLRAGEPVHFEQEFDFDLVKDLKLYPTGRSGTIFLEIFISPLAPGDGIPSGYLVHVLETTEHKRLEEQLFQSQKMESIGQLAGGVAHDFNNYLTAIQGYIDLALEDLPPESPIFEDLQGARDSSIRAANLTRQLLLFGHREEAHPKLVNLNTVITNLTRMLERLIGEQYSIITEMEEDLWIVNVDVGHLEQIIMNLTINARDSMPDGGTITIGTYNIANARHPGRPEEAPGRYACFWLQDTGMGMDAETRSHIFEPFFSTKGGGGGIGLGLSVVYGIVAQHGGWIDVESAPDEGSTFSICLPAVEAKPEMIAPTVTAAKFEGHGERILLVEDEDSIRSLTGRVLSSNGYQVMAAKDADDALRCFDEAGGDFELVFSDVVLPGENGVRLADRLVERNPAISVLMTSGYSDVAALRDIHERGFGFVPKPYSLTEVMSVIQDLLEKKKSG